MLIFAKSGQFIFESFRNRAIVITFGQLLRPSSYDEEFLIILTLFSGFSSAFSQAEYKSKNRQYDIQLDTLSNGIWTLPDTADNKVIDSLFISYTGLPDYGDLIVPDLELMMKSAWYESKAFFFSGSSTTPL